MDTQSDLEAELHNVLYRIELSVLYHQKRDRFFEVWDKVFKAIAVIGGSAAWAKMGAHVAAPVITITSAISLVFNLSDRSKKHAELARSYRQLDAEIAGERISYTREDISRWDRQCRLLETTEPAALSMLVRICQNELAIAQNQPEKVVNVTLCDRLLAHLFDLSTGVKS